MGWSRRRTVLLSVVFGAALAGAAHVLVVSFEVGWATPAAGFFVLFLVYSSSQARSSASQGARSSLSVAAGTADPAHSSFSRSRVTP